MNTYNHSNTNYFNKDDTVSQQCCCFPQSSLVSFQITKELNHNVFTKDIFISQNYISAPFSALNYCFTSSLFHDNEWASYRRKTTPKYLIWIQSVLWQLHSMETYFYFPPSCSCLVSDLANALHVS